MNLINSRITRRLHLQLRAFARLALLGLTMGMVVSACESDGGNGSCDPGAEGCSCYGGTHCATGLSCISGFCVNPASGDDETGDPTGAEDPTGEDDSTGDGDETGDGDGEPQGPDDNWNPCLALIECVKEVEPAAVSALAKAYGVEGTCYEIAGLTKEDCWAECEALREDYGGNTLAPECAHFLCNNGVLDITEMCDSDESTCNPHCELTEHECSPLTGVGCIGNAECVIGVKEFVTFPPSEDLYTYKFQLQCGYRLQGTAGMHDLCGTNINVGCSEKTPLCIAGIPQCKHDACCTQYCSLAPHSLPNGKCPSGYECQALPEAIIHYNWIPGAEFIGICV